MRTAQQRWTPESGWIQAPESTLPNAQLVLVFGSRAALGCPDWRAAVHEQYPAARIIGCSTAGEILGEQVFDDSITCTALEFSKATLRIETASVADSTESHAAGAVLAGRLRDPGLRHVVVLSDGLNVNGSALVSGLAENLPPDVGVTGGLSGDGDRFEETLLLVDDHLSSRAVVAVGFYGDALVVGCASLGGWDPFGPERVITRSHDNVLHELDGKSALALYSSYLGEHAAGLPATALLFPLSVRTNTTERPVVRTVLAVDADAGTMTFAGDVPQGAYAQLMRANFDRLIDGAAGAARSSCGPLGTLKAEFALLISCVGRKLVLGQRIEEEVESVREVLGPGAALAGFYSYGEISPFTPTARCELHNQTMTITTFAER